MSKDTGIQWTDHTFNPWWGCTKVSPGCANCYAETHSNRYGFRIWGQDVGRRTFSDEHWNEPMLWQRDAKRAGVRRRVFCASMADVFEAREDLHVERSRLWRLIDATPDLDWQLLTKRPENMIRLTPMDWRGGWPSNVWAMTSIENQTIADRRIPILREVPARIRGLSAEPLLDRVETDLTGIHWVIIGGESGHSARPMDLQWVGAILRACQDARVACFVKQFGARPYMTFAVAGQGVQDEQIKLKDKKGGDMTEWPASYRVREFPPEARP